MNQDRIGAGPPVSFAALEGFGQSPTCDKGFHPGNDAEVFISLGVFAGLDLAAKRLYIFQLLLLALDKAIGFREQFVFDTDTCDVALLQLAHQAAHVIEVAVTSVAIEQDRYRGRVGHEFQDIDDLGPAEFVVIADRMLGRQGQTRAPDTLEASLFNYFCCQAIVRLENELGLTRMEQALQLGRLFHLGHFHLLKIPGSRNGSREAPRFLHEARLRESRSRSTAIR